MSRKVSCTDPNAHKEDSDDKAKTSMNFNRSNSKPFMSFVSDSITVVDGILNNSKQFQNFYNEEITDLTNAMNSHECDYKELIHNFKKQGNHASAFDDVVKTRMFLDGLSKDKLKKRGNKRTNISKNINDLKKNDFDVNLNPLGLPKNSTAYVCIKVKE